MDFASLMSSQISKSKPRQPISELSSSKYLRRSELENARRAAYEIEQSKIEAEREDRLIHKRRIEEDESERNQIREEKKRRLAEESKARREEDEEKEERRRRRRLGLPSLPSEGSSDGKEKSSTPAMEGEEDLTEEALTANLRSFNEPAMFFDETHTERLRRYYKIKQRSLTPKLSKTPIPTTLGLLPESELLVPTSVPMDTDRQGRAHLYQQLASFFTLLLTEWSSALSERPASVAQSSSGVAATATYTAVLKDLTPLFRRFETATLPADLLKPIAMIVREAQQRRYVAANDLYLQLSIGKAAWPIGVTMVGIHERSAREKLHSNDGGDRQAHIMSDEVTRKYLQSIKRCLSFAQTRWPPEDKGQLMG